MEKNRKSNIDEKESRKRRRERIIMIVVGILAITFTLIASHFFNKDDLPCQQTFSFMALPVLILF